ncbi:MAG: glycosyltransferase family 4 protein [Phascolarctobacterium sp.]|nr:glycosyltransferase family 4 protein [Candidatus Phascolarctobacterium caballi]
MKVVVNYVSKHSYLYAQKMVEGLLANDCEVFAIVSKNMPEIDAWRKMQNIILYEVDGYTTIKSFPFKLLKFLVCDVIKIRKRVKDMEIQQNFCPFVSYWSPFVNLALKNLPLTFVMHDPIPHEGKDKIIGWFNTYMGRVAKNIIVLSKQFEDFVKNKYSAKVMVVQGGVEVENFDDKVELLKYDESRINFVFQGRIEKYKGLEILASAYKTLLKKYEDKIFLVVAGSGDFRPYADLFDNLPNCCILNQWLTNAEVIGLFNDRNTICVLPYTSATQSGVINVAMPCGTPIIASACGGIIEQIRDNVTGWLVAPGDVDALVSKMSYVIEHREKWENIRQGGYEHVKALKWDNLAHKIMEGFKL